MYDNDNENSLSGINMYEGQLDSIDTLLTLINVLNMIHIILTSILS